MPGLADEGLSIHRKTKWSEQMHLRLSQALNNAELKSLCSALLQTDSDALLHLDQMLSFLKPLFSSKKPIRAVQNLKNSWFDQECRDLKINKEPETD